MKILITGGSGFIGTHLAQNFIQAGHDVTILSRSKPRVPVAHIPVPAYTATHISRSLQTLQFDVVVHLIAAGSVPSDRNILTLTQVNAILPGVFVEVAVKCGARGVIMAGSYAEYADKKKTEPLRETDTLEDSEVYGASKAAGSEFALEQGKFYDIPVVVTRLFNVYGLNDTLPHRLFPSLFSKLLHNEPVKLSLGRQVRDFVYIKDVCSAYLAMVTALDTGTISSGAYNIATGVPYSVAEFAYNTASALKADPSLIQLGALPERTVPDAAYVVGSPEKLQQSIGWQCTYSLEDGLKDCVQGSIL